MRTFPRGPEPCPEELCQWRPREPQILSSSRPPARPSTTVPSLSGLPRGVHLDSLPSRLLAWLLSPRAFPCLPCLPGVAPKDSPRWVLGCGGVRRGAESWTELGTWPGLSAGPGTRFCTKKKNQTSNEGERKKKNKTFLCLGVPRAGVPRRRPVAQRPGGCEILRAG